MVFLPLLILPTKYSKYSYLGSQLSIFQNCMLWKFKFSLTLNYKYVYVVYMICIIHIYFMDCFFFFKLNQTTFIKGLKSWNTVQSATCITRVVRNLSCLIHYTQSIKIQTHNPLES